LSKDVALSDDEWRELARQFVASRNDEACIALMFRFHAIFGHLRKVLGCSKIDRHHFEYAVKGGRVDLALFHTDGGISLVEFKVDGPVHAVVAGIGQLFFYEAMFLRKAQRSSKPSYIKKYLVSPVAGDDAQSVAEACELAGVQFVQCAPFAMVSGHRQRCIESWVENHA